MFNFLFYYVFILYIIFYKKKVKINLKKKLKNLCGGPWPSCKPSKVRHWFRVFTFETFTLRDS